jgi:hypothetical protein
MATILEYIERRKTDVLKIIKKRTVAITVYMVSMLLWQRWELMGMISNDITCNMIEKNSDLFY